MKMGEKYFFNESSELIRSQEKNSDTINILAN